MKVPVLALQGDFAEHISALKKCGVESFALKYSSELNDADGLIIPGGESTAIAKLTSENDDPIFDTIRTKVSAGLPVYGTCMGSIFLAKDIEGSNQGRLALMDITVKRNGFGPQRASFQTAVHIPCLDEAGDSSIPFPTVFIRAPLIIEHGAKVKVLATVNDGVIMARQDNMLVTTFHPEITEDLRVHRYFLRMVCR